MSPSRAGSVGAAPATCGICRFRCSRIQPSSAGRWAGHVLVRRDVVVKPADVDLEELAWQAQIFSQIPSGGFRLARPRRAADGLLFVNGWCATEYVTGTHEAGRWPEIIAVGERSTRLCAGFRGHLSLISDPAGGD
jgi:hypothetical protein